jgi:hypothetical protein
MGALASIDQLTAGLSIAVDAGAAVTVYFDAASLTRGEVAHPYAPGPGPVMVWNMDHSTLESLDNQDDLANGDIDVPTVTGGICKDGTIAVLLRVSVVDDEFTGTTATDAKLVLYKKGETDLDKYIYLRPIPGGDSTTVMREQHVWVELDSGGEFHWQVQTNGTTSFSFRIRLVAYLRPQ